MHILPNDSVPLDRFPCHIVMALKTDLASLRVRLACVLSQALSARPIRLSGTKIAIKSISGHLLETRLQKAGQCSSICSADGFSLE